MGIWLCSISKINLKNAGFKVSTAVTMKNAVLCELAHVGSDVSEEHILSIIGVTRIGEIGIKLSVTNN
jgi:hypothetical protein